jgi:hypothetical protein
MDGAPRLSSAAGREAKKAPSKKTGALSAGYAIDLRYNIDRVDDYCLQTVAETRILCGKRSLIDSEV